MSSYTYSPGSPSKYAAIFKPDGRSLIFRPDHDEGEKHQREIVDELNAVETARRENAVALAQAVQRADESERREKVMRDALRELIDSRGGSGKRINAAWQNARFAMRCTGQGILRLVGKENRG